MKSYFLALFLVATSATAGTWYVDVNRPDDLGAGTNLVTAFKTIQAAVNVCGDGDTVLVNDGHYLLSSTVNNAFSPYPSITIKSINGPEVTIVDGNNSTRCFRIMGDTTIDGFTITRGYGDPIGPYGDNYNGGGIYGSTMAADDIVISNCIIENNVSEGLGGGVYGVLGNKLYNCVIRNNRSEDNGGGLAGVSTHNCLIYDNVVDHPTSMAGGGGVYNGLHVNSTIVYNTCDWRGGGAYLSINNSGLINCIVFGNTAGVEGDNLYYYNNPTLTSSCSPDLAHGVDGNSTNSPSFRDSAGKDYRLLPNSPCRNAGDNTSVSTEHDLAGNQRIIDSIVDIGAYEYQGLTLLINLQESFGLQSWTNTGKSIIWEVPIDSSNQFYRAKIEIID